MNLALQIALLQAKTVLAALVANKAIRLSKSDKALLRELRSLLDTLIGK